MTPLVLILSLIVQQAPTPKSDWYAASGYCGFGMEVAAAGDVDRDGSPDLVVGDDGYAEEGLAPTFWIVSAKDGRVLRTITPPKFESSNYRVEGGHDIDGDGVPDLLISAAPFTGPKTPSVVHLISGASGKILRTLAANTVRRDEGEWARFVRDVDGDGADDVALLSCNAEATHRTLRVHSSRTGAELLRIPIERACGDGPCGFVEVEGKTPATSGYVVLLDGGEKHPPFAQFLSRESQKVLWQVEAPTKIGASCGVLAILRGEPRVAIGYVDCVDVVDVTNGDRVHRFEPKGKTDSVMGFGSSVAALGDIDADGVGDLAIAETEDYMFVGAIHAKSGKSGDALWTMRPEFDDDVHHLGYQLAALGDVDGDGISDLVVGTWEGKAGVAGRVFILSGKTGKIVREFRRKGDTVVVMPRKDASVPTAK